MIRFWRLNERTEDNLGLACTEDGLFLGRTPLIERRGQRFVVREKGEIERLLKRAYQNAPAADGLMSRLATVAAALNADDQCLARIAAVHLQIPDLPSEAARNGMEAEDVLIKSGDWNPALHPRAGTPPNPGWFAPTDGGIEVVPPIRFAQNEDRSRATDATAGPSEKRATLPPGERIDELGDFVEWLANAKPEDEKAIRAEIKRYYYDVGDTFGGDALNAALSDVLEPGVTPEIRQQILNGIAHYAVSDPAEVAQARNLAVGGILLFSGKPSTAAVIETPSEAWKLGWAARGQYFDKLLRDGSLPLGFRTIDNFTSGIATSIKSIDLNAATYQDATRLVSRVTKYIANVADYEGGSFANKIVLPEEITGRAVNLVVPKGSMTEEQRIAIETVRALARTGKISVNLIITPL